MSKDKIEIIYEDSDIIVINKPCGISVTADRSGSADLLGLLKDQLGADADLRVVYRLDKAASGIMIVAKNKLAQSACSSMFAKQQIKMTCLALVSGVVTEEEGLIDLPLSRSGRDVSLMKVDRKHGKEALTRWNLLADFGMVSLLAVQPMTQRTHQVRVHLAGVGMPLAIDPLYGGRKPVLLSDFKASYRLKGGKREKPLIKRLTLHAYKLEIPNDETGSKVYIAKLDKKFLATIKMLARHNEKGPGAFLNEQDLEAILKAGNLSRAEGY